MSTKGAREWKTREKDSMSTRRARWDADQMKDAVDFYGKNRAMGNVRGGTGAGKGDKRRPTDAEMYEAGYMAAYAETPAEREQWKKKWRALRDRKRHGTEM
jgi:hypothetical protein